MFNFLGKMFGTEKALTAIIDSASAGLDKLVYTDEEKADTAAKERSEARAMVVDWMRATQGQNLARRLIALSITIGWLSQYLTAQLLSCVAIWSNHAAQLHDSAKVLLEGASGMSDAVMLILAFYFAAPHMGDIARSILQPKNQKT